MTKLENGIGGLNWYLLYCKPREEARARANLANQNIDSFFPCLRLDKVRGRKLVVVEEPLFPGYLFVRLDFSLHVITTIRSTRGVANFVRFGKESMPRPVPDSLVARLMLDCLDNELNQELLDKISCSPKPGDKVLINDGPYQNLEAIYQAKDGLERSIMLIKMIGKEVSVSIANKGIVKLD